MPDGSPDREREATLLDGAIAERPRRVHRHPLLDAVYQGHDHRISQYASGRVLEVASGEHAHPEADATIDIHPGNPAAGRDHAVADARCLPFHENAFDTIVGRRFLHHVPPTDRVPLLAECRRVLSPDGCLVVLEGTPGLYRRVTKTVAFRLGVLGEDTDEYGHLSRQELLATVQAAGFSVETEQQLGSPLMPLAIGTAAPLRRLRGFVERTQWVRWWTLVAATPEVTEDPVPRRRRRIESDRDEEDKATPPGTRTVLVTHQYEQEIDADRLEEWLDASFPEGRAQVIDRETGEMLHDGF